MSDLEDRVAVLEELTAILRTALERTWTVATLQRQLQTRMGRLWAQQEALKPKGKVE